MTTTRLLKQRRFLPLFVTQFLGAFNDNLLKFALLFLANFGLYAAQPDKAELLATMREEPQMNALEAQWNGMKTLRAGFTTVRNLGDDGATMALREAIERGWVQGPRIIDAASSSPGVRA